MAATEIGSLRIALGMNAGEFDRGLKQASVDLAKFADLASSTAKVAAAAIAGAFAAAGIAVGKAFGDMDQINKMSQSAGIAVTALSGLAFAAKLSDVSIEDLGKSVGKLSKNMEEIASGDKAGVAARSMAALGVSVTDASGRMKNAEQVMLEISDKFAGMQDGAGKTALAMNIFGKSGAAMIPLLNGGAEAIRQQKIEAEQLGLTFDGKASAAAERFNDGLTKLGQVFNGVSRTIVSEFGPSMAAAIEKMVDWVRESGAVKIAAETIIASIKGIVNVGIDAAAMWSKLQLETRAFVANAQDLFNPSRWSAIADRNRIVAAQIDKIMGDAEYSKRTMWETTAKTQEQIAKEFQAKVAAPIIQGTDAMKASQAALNEENRAWAQLITQGVKLAEGTRSPQEIFADKAKALDAAFASNDISAERFAAAMQQASMVSQNAYAAMASGIAGSLQQAFAHSKAVAVASALINTYESVTKALATYPPPFSYVAAAASMAAGLAQVANINKTTKGSSGGGGGSVGAGAAAAPVGPGAGNTLTIQGFDPNLMYSGNSVKQLVQTLIKYQKDGGTILVK